MTAETSFTVALFNLILMGFGLGTTFPTYTIAIQNSVHPRFMGVATSTSQFFRSVGGLLGLAILGSVLTNRFSSKFLGSVGADAEVRTGRRPVEGPCPQSPGAGQRRGPGRTSRDVQCSRALKALTLLDGVMESLRSALSSAIADVFLISLFVIIIAIVATLFLKEVPLRESPVAQRGG